MSCHPRWRTDEEARAHSRVARTRHDSCIGGEHMKRYLSIVVVGAALWYVGSASAAALCVGPQAGCFSQLQPAVAAAHDGDTITVAPGTYAGGVTIDKSIRLQGAGAAQTVISGGGPVLTIGRLTDPTGQTVSI